jgi:multidrug resistance efflux pump
MDRLPPIPVPLATRWREFRLRVLPVFLTLATLAAASWLWRYEKALGNFAGIAEGARATVSSPRPGAIRQLLVQPFQIVQAGQPLAVLVPGDPRTELDVLQSELQLARLSVEPSLPEQNAVGYERLRFDLLRMQSELASAQIDLQRAENQVRRQKPLFDEKLLSEDMFDLADKTRESILAEVQVKSNAVIQMEQRLSELRELGELEPRVPANPAMQVLSSLLARHRAVLTNLGPITLSAPISGMISVVNRRAGEQVVEGEPLMIISSPRAERVVGYLRQPYPMHPEVGMEAVLTTRELKRRQFVGFVSQVGVQLEYITNSLALLRPGALVDTGLPVVIEFSPETHIRPGEIVDIAIRQPLIPQLSSGDKPVVAQALLSAQEGEYALP